MNENAPCPEKQVAKVKTCVMRSDEKVANISLEVAKLLAAR